MSIEKLTAGGFSIGVELPLDNDWSAAGEASRQRDGRPFGVPDMQRHAELIELADDLGFRAAWVRDVPLYDPSFGDAAQVFETFTYLGYLASHTRNILLGTAAVVLPLRNPWLVRKAAATVQALSGQRLMLGVASGDRPSEYPVFGVDFNSRGERFRQAVRVLQGEQDARLAPGIELLPQAPQPPLLVAGLAQQSPAWVGEQMQGWLAYPGTPAEHIKRVGLWREVAGTKPYISFIHLDLVEDPDAPIQRHRFGISAGRKGLIQELEAMQAAGVDHIGLHFRRNQRPLDETFHEISESVLPIFHNR
ncbi:TIGR03571 family LLM class oxidoreductase [Marinobacter sp. G11]|jgi:luciferase-type oxidoreductase|uniref:TIGR03571 family LLM class oxidoreductase n=1 Tax=Marinobacter sp. G11 TaxID=2903522 RepID=UPI001E3AABE6|nr:TIGR03571 family LLM class oxidoreductase [Marinobacter sp. G11]MCE0761108.1 TIGR03571 family LLM class oxidoreductase [Marinobacter sp. G11]